MEYLLQNNLWTGQLYDVAKQFNQIFKEYMHESQKVVEELMRLGTCFLNFGFLHESPIIVGTAVSCLKHKNYVSKVPKVFS